MAILILENFSGGKFVNRLKFLIGVFILLAYPTFVYGQSNNQIDSFASLSIELWPDYDRPELLVIISGSLPPTTPLPAEVVLPLPATATVNAVARFTAHNALVSDMAYTAVDSQLRFTTPDAEFQIEYYQPYEINGSQHKINFSWTAPQPIQQLIVTVQEPLNATAFNLSQEVSQVRQNTDNLRYHVLPPLTLNKGETVSLDVFYELPAGSLSRPIVPPAAEVNESAIVPVASVPTTSPTSWWLYILGSAMLVFSIVMIGWGIYDGRQSKQATKLKPRRQRIVYCPQCGQSVKEDVQFCPNCGHEFQ